MTNPRRLDTSKTVENARRAVIEMMDSQDNPKSADEKFNLALGHLIPIVHCCGPKVQASLEETPIEAAPDLDDFNRRAYLAHILIYAGQDHLKDCEENGKPLGLLDIFGSSS